MEIVERTRIDLRTTLHLKLRNADGQEGDLFAKRYFIQYGNEEKHRIVWKIGEVSYYPEDAFWAQLEGAFLRWTEKNNGPQGAEKLSAHA